MKIAMTEIRIARSTGVHRCIRREERGPVMRRRRQGSPRQSSPKRPAGTTTGLDDVRAAVAEVRRRQQRPAGARRRPVGRARSSVRARAGKRSPEQVERQGAGRDGLK